MQAEAVAESVRVLQEHAQSESSGLPVGQARGKIILPCGTGKTRISLRIIEQLTPQGELSVVLCPSIALVAQIRREYLQYAQSRLRALAVCSDETAGYCPAKEGARDTASDPTLDNSNVSASVVKGKVTTDPSAIAQWIRDGKGAARVSVIFGTYQSGRSVADALQETGVTLRVLIADEAHRTAGLRRKKGARSTLLSRDEQRVRDFTLCHDNDACPPPTASIRPPRPGSMTPPESGATTTATGLSVRWTTKRSSVSSCTGKATWKRSRTAGSPTTASSPWPSTTPTPTTSPTILPPSPRARGATGSPPPTSSVASPLPWQWAAQPWTRRTAAFPSSPASPS